MAAARVARAAATNSPIFTSTPLYHLCIYACRYPTLPTWDRPDYSRG